MVSIILWLQHFPANMLFLKRLSGFIALSGWEVGLPQGQPHTDMNLQGKQRWIYFSFPSKARPEARWSPQRDSGDEGWHPLHGASSHMLLVWPFF